MHPIVKGNSGEPITRRLLEKNPQDKDSSQNVSTSNELEELHSRVSSQIFDNFPLRNCAKELSEFEIFFILQRYFIS